MRTAPIVAALLAGLLLAPAHAQVSSSRIAAAPDGSGEWLTYSGSYRSIRFSPLKQISVDNVARLRPAWVYQAPGASTLETTPLVADGRMYITGAANSVIALHLASGRPLWRWSRPVARRTATLGFGRVNRGVALLGDNVYVGTIEGHLVALDARSGIERWDVPVADNKVGYAITGAPLAADGKIFVGISGGEAGVRGFLDAYDPQTGKRLWRFWTIPEPGQPHADSWPGDTWKHGGATTWLTGSYDPELNLLYWGTGNPGPWNGDARTGDNLYSCSLLALDPKTGTLKWHFQFTPHDVHDWDANQIPMLIDAAVDGRQRHLIATANRNGFLYLLDRATGEFVRGAPFAKQTWASGLDAHGRPIVLPNSEPSDTGTLVYPSLQGASNWASPAYDPASGLMFVPVRQMGSIYFKTPAEYHAGTYYTGMSERALDEEATGAIRAFDVTSGKEAWSFPLPSPPWAGLLATAGGLVFGGSNEGNFFALNASTGKALWQFQTGAPIGASPMSFAVDGRQHVAVAAGRALFVFSLD
jgi:alcohol dehydrogenase (cytochrome c)